MNSSSAVSIPLAEVFILLHTVSSRETESRKPGWGCFVDWPEVEADAKTNKITGHGGQPRSSAIGDVREANSSTN
jgi:hypothetical protein